jgi:hypothetical protein
MYETRNCEKLVGRSREEADGWQIDLHRDLPEKKTRLALAQQKQKRRIESKVTAGKEAAQREEKT